MRYALKVTGASIREVSAVPWRTAPPAIAAEDWCCCCLKSRIQLRSCRGEAERRRESVSDALKDGTKRLQRLGTKWLYSKKMGDLGRLCPSQTTQSVPTVV
jgi:hypothetical protein